MNPGRYERRLTHPLSASNLVVRSALGWDSLRFSDIEICIDNFVRTEDPSILPLRYVPFVPIFPGRQKDS